MGEVARTTKFRSSPCLAGVRPITSLHTDIREAIISSSG
ncbi:hypothetical protein SSKA14_352 [Stenotrophomonas sp. SKA14]|nr:hypothetical protein SSKA14_352 [Stenotrophomonas sp. SKA14]